jgi:hypothetical protein
LEFSCGLLLQRSNSGSKELKGLEYRLALSVGHRCHYTTKAIKARSLNLGSHAPSSLSELDTPAARVVGCHLLLRVLVSLKSRAKPSDVALVESEVLAEVRL